jgi:hypothetical protein
MVFLTDRDLERLVSLRINWKKSYLDEVVRLLQTNATSSPFKLNMSVQVNDMEVGERLARVMFDVEVVDLAAMDLINPPLAYDESGSENPGELFADQNP